MYDFIPAKVDETRNDLDNIPRYEIARIKVKGPNGKSIVYRNVKLLITSLVDRNCAVKCWLQDKGLSYAKFKILKFRETAWDLKT